MIYDVVEAYFRDAETSIFVCCFIQLPGTTEQIIEALSYLTAVTAEVFYNNSFYFETFRFEF